MSCDQFITQAGAYLRAHLNDPDGLDEDANGIACEVAPVTFDRMAEPRKVEDTNDDGEPDAPALPESPEPGIPQGTFIVLPFDLYNRAVLVQRAGGDINPILLEPADRSVAAAQAGITPPNTGDRGLLP